MATALMSEPVALELTARTRVLPQQAVLDKIEEALELPDFASNARAHDCFARGDWAGLRESFAAVPLPYDATASVAKFDVWYIEASIDKIKALIEQHGDDGILCYCQELDELEEELRAARKTLTMSRARFGLELLIAA